MIGKKIAGNTFTPFDVVVYEYENEYIGESKECDIISCHNPVKYLFVTQMRWACQVYQQQVICNYHGNHALQGLKEQKIGGGAA